MTDRDTDILARTICGEARGEGQGGMECVAMVVMNRCEIAKPYLAKHDKRHPLFGDGSPASACLMPWQFSCWNQNDPNRAIIEALGPEKAIFRQAMNIAEDAIAGSLADRTGGATHYYDRRSPTPSWAEGKAPCYTEGHHLFFNNIE